MLDKLKAILRRKPQSDKQGQTCTAEGRFTGNIKKDEQLLRGMYKDCADVKYRQLTIPSMNKRSCLVIFTEGLTNSDNFNRDIIGALLSEREESVNSIAELISVGETSTYKCMSDVKHDILLGKTAILVDGMAGILVVDNKEWPMRGIEEPLQERLIRGPREGFTEVMLVSLGLIRRRLPDPKLKVYQTQVGRRSRTKVSVCYIEDICNLDLVEEIKERIDAIDIDGLLDPGTLTELITERTLSPFPLLISTERPDKVVGGLLQGKVAIVTDGSPFVSLAPITAPDFFQIPEDYYMHSLYGTLARVLRLGGIFLGTTFTAAYTAIISYHYEMIPQDIIVFIAETREGVPFSPITEALLLEGAVELLREASIRLPGPIGPTLGIVGALILGQAAVDAQLVSPVLLIVVATSFLAGSSIPNYEASLVIRFLRFPLLVMAGFL